MKTILLNKLVACILMISLGVPMAVNARKVTDYQVYEQEEPSGWLGLIWEKTTLDAKTFSGLILAAAAVFGISTWRNARVRNAEAAVPVVEAAAEAVVEAVPVTLEAIRRQAAEAGITPAKIWIVLAGEAPEAEKIADLQELIAGVAAPAGE